jgi:hypothetical protein
VIDECGIEVRDKISRGKTLESRFKGKYSVPYEYQDAMRTLKLKISELLSKLESHRKWLETLLNDDDKMALMNLTLLRAKPELYK